MSVDTTDGGQKISTVLDGAGPTSYEYIVGNNSGKNSNKSSHRGRNN